ncbi:transcriptional regulator-like protein [Anaeromyxobacter dehalogenans 2CP-1]|uniref:Transcriptional regulator-like protein n=1 Tax=Anaeromyxobacter dehalogenans (strain ATCC BAA-258 / DSM 21875 / 2CP-1) TaxID=455488 RepID=B8JC43_ANAD2|nr:WYL domain-containing protein [Anaeromyxobacter dehalogenans]ACL63965.1 transcriptional regulator-like protein [Anaeromyxobacter dehalogenans 2CP-1]
MSAAGSRRRPAGARAKAPTKAAAAKAPPAAKPARGAARAAPRPSARAPAAPKKADPRDRLRRVLFLVPYAVRHPGIPVRDLARRCGCTEKELLEDLDFLLEVGSPPFAPDDFLDLYVEGDRVYVALHQSFSRPPRFTESEAAALAAAAAALGGEGRERAVKALRDSVPRDRRASFDELVERIYAGAPPARDSVLGRLQRAIAERRAVRLAYHSASRDAETDRTVRPYTLAQRFGHWYLYGHDAERGKALAFRLDRIRECTLLPERFEPPTEAELARARLFSEAAGEPVRIRLGAQAAPWAVSRPGISLVERTPGGGAVVEVAGAGNDWATRFALSLGGGAEVVAPAAARRAFAETVRRTLARYR